MIPSPWEGLVLALAVFRLCRLAGWDDFPPVQRARDRITGARLTNSQDWVYKRPTLAALILCPFCLGFYVSLAMYGAWLLWPNAILRYVAAPLALAAAAGLIAKRLDP